MSNVLEKLAELQNGHEITHDAGLEKIELRNQMSDLKNRENKRQIEIVETKLKEKE